MSIILLWSSLLLAPVGLPAAARQEAHAAEQTATLAALEERLLGVNFTDIPQTERLAQLENYSFGKTFPGESDSKRLNRLKNTYQVAATPIPPEIKAALASTPSTEASASSSNEQKTSTPITAQPSVSNRPKIKKVELQPNNDKLAEMVAEIINQERSFRSLKSLYIDPIASEVALEQASYLVQTGQFSHFGFRGKNPDQRYSEAGGDGRVAEIVDGFFAEVDENGQVDPIQVSSELPHKLIDAFLENPDKTNVIFDNQANQLGVAFVRSPNKNQLVVVIEVVADYVQLAELPNELAGASQQTISGNLDPGWKLAWIGISQQGNTPVELVELEPSPYFPPIDEVIYMDKTANRSKAIAQAGGMILAIVAAPFTYGASVLLLDVLMQQISQTYQAHDVEVRGGINADMDGHFRGEISLGEQGSGLYYISIWGNDGKSKKPVIVGRRTVKIG